MKVYIVSQGKGGVGKTTIATMLASYLLLKNKVIQVIDTDGVNQTLSAFKALNVKEKNILSDDYQTSDLTKIDDFFSDLLEDQEADKTVIIDIGASSFLPIRSHIFQNEIYKMIDITFVIPICGGTSEDSSMLGISDTLKDFENGVNYLIVQNERDGKLKFKNSKLEKQLQSLEKNYIGDVTLEKISGILATDFEIVNKNKIIFQQIEKCKDLKILNRKRLEIFFKKFFAQLQNIGV